MIFSAIPQLFDDYSLLNDKDTGIRSFVHNYRAGEQERKQGSGVLIPHALLMCFSFYQRKRNAGKTPHQILHKSSDFITHIFTGAKITVREIGSPETRNINRHK